MNQENFDILMKDGKTPRCQEQVCTYQGMAAHWHQCYRSAKVGDRCRQHDPAAVKARDEARTVKYNREQRVWLIRVSGHRFLDVLRQIADGHDDPGTLARDTIKEFERDD